MKNDTFLWCRYRVKNWLITLKCKSTRLSNENEFMPSNLHAFLWQTSTLVVTSSLTTQIRYEFCWKIIDQNFARMSIETHNALSNGPRQPNLVLITYASSEGSGEPAHPRSLARTFAARSYKQWIKRNLQTENQIPGPSEWLGMRSWNL